MRALGILVLTAAAGASAQELEPRSYTNTPIGVNFLLAGYVYTEGNVAFDPALPLTDARLRTHNAVLGLAHTLNVAGQSAKVSLLLPYSGLSGNALYLGDPVQREITGWGDPLFRFSANLYGAPALSLKEYANFRQDLIIGATLTLAAPWGQYDPTKLLNIGANRWVVRPEVGISKAWGAWILELAPGVTFFADNDDFFGGKRREQDPLYSVQGHLIYSFRSGAWGAVNGTWYSGGRTTVDGVRSNDLQTNTRLGATVVLPVNRHNSIRFQVSTGMSSRTGSDFNAYGVAWQYRWGGGL